MKNKLLVMGIAALSFFFSVKTNAQTPTAAFSLNQATICAGGTLQITDASSDSPTAWSYTVEGGATLTSTVQNPSFVLSTVGDYSITLVATNVNGNGTPLTQTMTVKALPTVAAGASVEVCTGDFITLNGSGASTYTWSGGVIDGASFAPTASTVYTVTGTDSFGCENTATVPVAVNSLPVLTVNGDASVCIGSALTLTVSGADTFTWSTAANTNTITDGPLVNTTYSVSGTDAITGCTNTVTKVVTVNALPTVIVNSGSVCAGSVFTMTPGGASAYVFSNGSNTVAPTLSDSYTVTGTDANGCVAQAVSDVTVMALPVLSVNSGTICAGNVFTIVPTGASTYTYLPGLSATVNPSSTSSYSVTGTDANGCVSAVAAVTEVTVSPLPIVTVNSGSICAGNSFTIIPTSASAISFSFTGGTGTVSPTTSTSYTVIGEDALGCISAQAVSDVTVIALPVITVNSGSICAGSVFTMVPSGASTYTFVNNSATVSPLTNTSYSVNGSTAGGCVSLGYAVSDITVHALPVVSVTSGSICLGDTYTMTASGANTYNYQGGFATVSPVTNTSYTVTGVSTEGCTSANTATATVTVASLPVLAIAGTTAICEGESTVLNVTGASTYTWNTTNSNLSSYTVTPAANATYTVVGTDANGCSNFVSQLIVVNSLPTITVNSGVICPGGSFAIVPTGALTYSFTGGTATVSPASTTSYSVTGTDMNGCVSAMPAVSTVSVMPALTITISGNTTICSGQTTNLTAGGATTYSWNATVLTNTIAVNPTTTTSYTVTGISSGCSNTAAVSVVVNALPVVTVSSTSSLICIGENVTITSGGASTYSWSTGVNGASITVSPSVNTTYIVTGTDANSCSNSATIVQNVLDCTGLTKFENAVVNAGIYPNPTNGEFTVKLTQETSVKILNGIGQVVYTNKLANGENVITLNDQPNGIYFVQLKQGNQTKTVKVVKN